MSDDLIVVIGGGLAGLSFACAIEQERKKGRRDLPQVVVLERRSAALDSSSEKRYSYSMSIRSDVGGIQALEKLGICKLVRELGTGSKGLVVKIPLFGRLCTAIDTSRFSDRGVRVSRSNLWKCIEARASSLQVDIRYNCTVTNITNNTVSYYQHDETDTTELQTVLIVAADGNQSFTRSIADPSEKLNYLNAIILGCHVQKEAPIELLKNQYGMLLGRKYMVFFADEQRNNYLLSISSLTDRTEAELASMSLAQMKQEAEGLCRKSGLPQLVEDLFVEAKENTFFQVICRDKEPPRTLTKSGVVYIGDAAHAVSPFAGAGANLAMADGVLLSDKIVAGFANGQSLSEIAQAFITESAEKAQKIVLQQRGTIKMVHTESRYKCFLRNLGFFSLGFVAHNRKAIAGVVIASAVLCTGWWVRKYF